MSRLTAVFDCDSETMTVSPNRTMLPPIWVATCASQRRRKEPLRRTARAPRTAGVVGRPGVGRVDRVVDGGSPRRCPRGPVTPAVPGGRPRSGRGHRARRTRRAVVRGSPARAGRGGRSPGSAARCRRRGGRRATCRTPHGCARRRRTTSPSSRVRTGRAGTAGGYQSRGDRRSGRASRSVAGTATRIDRGDLDDDVGERRGELAR